MSITIYYKGDRKLEDALSDAKGYLGNDYEEVINTLAKAMETEKNKAWFLWQLSWAGIRGLPAEAMWLEVMHRIGDES